MYSHSMAKFVAKFPLLPYRHAKNAEVDATHALVNEGDMLLAKVYRRVKE